MQYINLTDHEIHELDSGILLPKSDNPIRAVSTSSYYTNEDGIKCHRSIITSLDKPLPERLSNTIYIVSALALNAVPNDRDDIVAPKKVQREPDGTIKGCRGFRHK